MNSHIKKYSSHYHLINHRHFFLQNLQNDFSWAIHRLRQRPFIHDVPKQTSFHDFYNHVWYPIPSPFWKSPFGFCLRPIPFCSNSLMFFLVVILWCPNLWCHNQLDTVTLILERPYWSLPLRKHFM
jgi:hypothetical protein